MLTLLPCLKITYKFHIRIFQMKIFDRGNFYKNLIESEKKYENIPDKETKRKQNKLTSCI